jgi:SAM-dependent methyltransferase
VLLLPTREEATTYPTGDIRLAFCHTCGFVFNAAFDPTLQHEYAERYEETQGYSPTFNAFATRLAERLIAQYDLHDKDIVEIGCGKGEFLSLLCKLGNNRGVGIDPSYVEDRSRSEPDPRVTFLKEFYSEEHARYKSDFLCCKMTLEHIDQTAEFVGTVARSTRHTPDTIIFFQIPNATRVIGDAAFWDIYYEHCSYFSPGSLARLFRNQGFDVLNLWTDYDDQYLMIEARPASGTNKTFPEMEDDMEQLGELVRQFPQKFEQKTSYWRDLLRQVRENNQRAVIWGSGSKGVAFLTTLGIRDEIEYSVDINPYKRGTYMAGTGQEIVGPDFLTEYQPDVVIVMNPVYVEEIRANLASMDLTPQVLAVE